MVFRNRRRCASFLAFAFSLLMIASFAPSDLHAQDEDNPKPERHGRKYKAPPETSHIEVTVLKGFNKKPIDGAHVIFHPVKDGLDEGNLEVKTHPDGKVTIDVIPIGSSVRIQVLADGFATYAEDYLVNENSRSIVISMIRPRQQISTYEDNEGKASQINPGVQEPIRPKKAPAAKPATAAPGDTKPSPAPNSSSDSATKPQQ